MGLRDVIFPAQRRDVLRVVHVTETLQNTFASAFIDFCGIYVQTQQRGIEL